MFQAYAQIRIINLPERSDRRREMMRELRRAGLSGDPRVQLFPAIRASTPAPWRSAGESGCFQSHHAILREAAAAGQSVLILEDDADFTAEAAKAPTDVDILWGGYTRRPEGRMEGAHCMGFSAPAVQRLVPFLDELVTQPSPAPIDGAYALFAQANPDLHLHLCDPMIALQRPSLSDIAGPRSLDRFPAARPLVKILRLAKRELQRRSRKRFETGITPY